MTRATRLVQGVIRLFYKAWVGLGVWGRADYHYSGQGTPLTPKAQIYRYCMRFQKKESSTPSVVSLFLLLDGFCLEVLKLYRVTTVLMHRFVAGDWGTGFRALSKNIGFRFRKGFG